MVFRPARWQRMAFSLEILVQLLEAICPFNTTARKVSGRGLSTPKAFSALCYKTVAIDIYLNNHCSILREELGRAVTTKNKHENVASLSYLRVFDRIQSQEIQTQKTHLNEIMFRQES